MRSSAQEQAPPRQGRSVPTAQPIHPGELAAREALRPLDWGEAPQIGIGGDTGAGKTTVELYLVELYLRLSPGLVVVIDDKAVTKFKGQTRRDIPHLRAEPLDPSGPRVLIIRGDVTRGVRADREAVARYCHGVAVRGRAVLLVNDEAFPKAVAKNRQWRKGVEYLPLGFTHGRQLGGGWANIWGNQLTIEAPAEPLNESTTILQFKTDGDPIRLLKEKQFLRGDPRLPDVIRSLHAMESPPHMRGDFVRLVRGVPWDGRVYRITLRKR